MVMQVKMFKQDSPPGALYPPAVGAVQEEINKWLKNNEHAEVENTQVALTGNSITVAVWYELRAGTKVTE